MVGKGVGRGGDQVGTDEDRGEKGADRVGVAGPGAEVRKETRPRWDLVSRSFRF